MHRQNGQGTFADLKMDLLPFAAFVLAYLPLELVQAPSVSLFSIREDQVALEEQVPVEQPWVSLLLA